MSFKDNLRRERGRVGLSQEGLAENMLVSRQTVSKWENGDTYPSTEHILMLARIFDCSMDELIENKFERQQSVKVIRDVSNRKYICWAVGAVAALLIVFFSFALFNFANFGRKNDAIDDSKIAVFDKMIDGSLDDAVMADGYTDKKIIGYGITEEDGTFYVKCDLYNSITGSSCSAIIYFCADDGGYSYRCQYLDNPNYIPKGEYYKVG